MLQISPLLVRALKYERTFPGMLRVFRVTASYAAGVGCALPTECEVVLSHLAACVEAGALAVDCTHPDTTFASKSRFGSAGARIVADAHRWFSTSDKPSGSGSGGGKNAAPRPYEDDDGDDGTVTGMAGLPKLVLALECWHMLTQQPQFLRHVFTDFDATAERTKVSAGLMKGGLSSLLIADLCCVDRYSSAC